MNERNNLPSRETHNNSELLSQFLGTTSEILARYTHCSLCGANLHFTHITDFNKNLTQETAQCLECGVRIRQVIHKLQ